MAYLRSVAIPGCNSCGRQSVKELFSHRCVSLGFYCLQHSDRALRTQRKREVRDYRPVELKEKRPRYLGTGVQP